MDYKNIQKRFNEVIEHSQGISDPITDELFATWFKNKKRFIDLFGGLTYEFPEEVTLNLPEEDKRIMMEDFATDCAMFSGDPEIKQFILKQGVDGFYSNRVTEEWASEYRKTKVQKGSKISKSFKIFFEDKDYLDRFQTKMSSLIQGCKINGKMVISVHPLDYLSASETAHNWHSCHALDGEYRAGNLSYMMDKHTILVYLKANKEYKLPNFPFEWNSKKWRVLLYIDNNAKAIFSGRQYPFSNAQAMTYVKDLFINKFFDTTGFTENWTDVDDVVEMAMRDGIGTMQYNDCLTSARYRTIALYDETRLGWDKMEIGEAITCLACGKSMVSLSSSMMCDECGDYSYCDCCGEPISRDDGYYLNESFLCEQCFDDTAVYCEECDTYYDSDEIRMEWDEQRECYICQNCLDRRGDED